MDIFFRDKVFGSQKPYKNSVKQLAKKHKKSNIIKDYILINQEKVLC